MLSRMASGIQRLLVRGGDHNRPSLERRVAYAWDVPVNSLGGRHAHHRDRVVLKWLAASLPASDGSVLDIGCAYGNHLLMLHAFLGGPQDVRFHGVDLDDEGLAFGKAFADHVPSYANCRYTNADVASGLPFGDSEFDAVNLADVLEHLLDPLSALVEIRRVLKPGGTLVVSTPLKDTLFKRVAVRMNRLTHGRIYRSYYRGKQTELDSAGQPMMMTRAGLDHVAEMTLEELDATVRAAGYDVAEVELMSVMSGSAWFDEHPAVLAPLFLLEALHLRLRRPSWAHSACLRLVAA